MEYIPTLLINTYLFIVGAAMGSFINVLSDRLPQERSIMGRSHCEECKHDLAWYDLFPLFSFIFLGGKCRYCKTTLSIYYPFVEIVTAVMFVLAWNFIPVNVTSSLVFGVDSILFIKVIYLVITSALLVVFFADLKFQIIPDSMQFFLLLSAVILRLIETNFNVNLVIYGLIEGLMVMAPILLLFVLTKGRGMGFGDVKLAFVIGVLFGVKLGFISIYLAFLFGAVAGILLILGKKKGLKSKIAFGPFIVLGMFITLFYKFEILQFVRQWWGV